MIDFSLTEEQKMLRQMAHDFAEKEMRPISLRADHEADPDECWKVAEPVVRKMLQLGLGKIGIPEKYGGTGGGMLDFLIVLEELAWGDVAMLGPLIVSNGVCQGLLLSGSEAQREKYIRPFCEDTSGEIIYCGSMTEPAGGAEMICPLPDPTLGMKGTAILDGDEYVLNATRVFCSEAKIAKAIMITLRTDMKKPNWSSLADFILPMDTPGVTVGRTADIIGNRASMQSEIFLDNVRVPKDSFVAKSNLDFCAYLTSGPVNGILAVGLARAAYEEALKYASERKIWGQPIREHQLIADKLVTMKMQIEAMRALTWKVAWAMEHPESSDGFMTLMQMAKIYCTSQIRGITAEAVQIMGAYGLSKDSLVEKWSRDAMYLPIVDCPNEVQKVFLAKRL